MRLAISISCVFSCLALFWLWNHLHAGLYFFSWPAAQEHLERKSIKLLNRFFAPLPFRFMQAQFFSCDGCSDEVAARRKAIFDLTETSLTQKCEKLFTLFQSLWTPWKEMDMFISLLSCKSLAMEASLQELSEKWKKKYPKCFLARTWLIAPPIPCRH